MDRYRFIVAAMVVVLWAAPAAGELSPQEARGRVIYRQGESPSGGEIVALMGDAGTEVPATIIPCGGCHGRDGRGRPEGGVTPSDLTWPALTKAYGVEHPSGRRHPPYTERSLKRAITMGVDPAGNRLHVAMPRYRLTVGDADDLVAYVKRLGEDDDPGLSDQVIVLATQVPREGPQASLGAAIEAVLEAAFAEVNRHGGIYRRHLELRVASSSPDVSTRAAALRQAADGAFALVGVYFPGAEEELAAVPRELEIPLVGPFSFRPHVDAGSPDPYLFYLLPGLDHLGRALVRFAASTPDAGAGSPRSRALVIAAEDPALLAAAGAITAAADELGWAAEVSATMVDDGGLAETAAAGTGAVFLLISADQQAEFLRRAASIAWYPKILLPGPLLGRAVFRAPSGFAGRIFLAFPTQPVDRQSLGLVEYDRLAERYALPASHLTAQLATLASARVLVEALERSGRELSRERLIESLETLVDFDTGLTPLVTYGPNRRVGAQGAYVMAVDLARGTLVPASGWIESR